MKSKYERQVARAERIEGFGIAHPLTPPHARATALFGQVTVVKLQMRDLGSNQVHGFGLFRGGVSERKALARELEQMLAGSGRRRVRSTQCSTRMRRSNSACRRGHVTSN